MSGRVVQFPHRREIPDDEPRLKLPAWGEKSHGALLLDQWADRARRAHVVELARQIRRLRANEREELVALLQGFTDAAQMREFNAVAEGMEGTIPVTIELVQAGAAILRPEAG